MDLWLFLGECLKKGCFLAQPHANLNQGTPVAAGLYSLSANGSDLASNRPAAYYAGAVCFVGMFFMLAIRFMNNKTILTRA